MFVVSFITAMGDEWPMRTPIHRLRGHLLVVAHGGRLEAALVSKITAIGERS
jgi:hypothetical protein